MLLVCCREFHLELFAGCCRFRSRPYRQRSDPGSAFRIDRLSCCPCRPCLDPRAPGHGCLCLSRCHVLSPRLPCLRLPGPLPSPLHGRRHSVRRCWKSTRFGSPMDIRRVRTDLAAIPGLDAENAESDHRFLHLPFLLGRSHLHRTHPGCARVPSPMVYDAGHAVAGLHCMALCAKKSPIGSSNCRLSLLSRKSTLRKRRARTPRL